ncbi:MAG: AAA family ATPase [Acidobacteriia bacterium]|nr:AAA family ATPase [Terriglobia bacterium]
MGHDPGMPSLGRIEPFDSDSLDARLREVATRLFPGRIVDDLEVRHLIRVITECSLLLTDVYSDERIERVMHPDRGLLVSLIRRLIEQERLGHGEVLYRVRRLPDDVRVIGDKALFDLGLLGLRQVKGYDLETLGARAYRMAGEALELLSEDRRLREFFKQNRLLMLPLEEEVVFLRQCSERFQVYESILKRMQAPGEVGETGRPDDLRTRVPLMAAAADVLSREEAALEAPAANSARAAGDPYLDAARAEGGAGTLMSRDELISAYERIVLFSSVDMDRLREALRAVVVDQDEAIEALCDEFSLFAAGTRDLRKPPAYFLVGPTGVGKNHLVESLCRLLEGVWQVEVPTLAIEGPSYTYPSDINELRGATRGFIRSDEEGLLTSFHERSSKAPLSVILVDEVEKAHVQLRTFFLSILDRGTTTDNRGKVLNFANTMIFFTSNLGYSDAQQRSAPIGYLDEDARTSSSDRDVRAGLRRALTPEFMNRVRMIHFNRLSQRSAERILDLEFLRIARRYREIHGLDLEVDASARVELIRRGFSPVFGARHLKTVLESVCNVEVAKKIRRDSRPVSQDLGAEVGRIRELRSGGRAFDPEEMKRRVLELARARLDYAAIRIAFGPRGFEYLPVPGRQAP